MGTGTTTALSVTLGGSAVTSVTYGSQVTLTADVTPAAGNTAPTAGYVDFQDGTTDLGSIFTEMPFGGSAIFTLVTTINQLQVIQANGGVHLVSATYFSGIGFSDSSGIFAGGLAVTPGRFSSLPPPILRTTTLARLPLQRLRFPV